uniref:Uncharacterized protein n=1 Tax=Tarenaya spinosa TaxID=228870 RepID=B2BXS2_9ROSI|nr:unknown [Tarenaya spinosa]
MAIQMNLLLLQDHHPQTVNVAPEQLQNQSAGGRNTEEPESSLNLDSVITISEESEVPTGMEDMEILCNGNSESIERSEESNLVKHESLGSSEQVMGGDEPETVRVVQEEPNTAQELQISVDSPAKGLKNDQSAITEEKDYGLSPEDKPRTLDDPSPSEKGVPVSFPNQSADERNTEEQEGSFVTLSEESRVDNSAIVETLYSDTSFKYAQSSEDKVQFLTKGTTEAEESKLENDRDVQEESKTAEEHGYFVAEELKNDQTARKEEREHKPSNPLPQLSWSDADKSP